MPCRVSVGVAPGVCVLERSVVSDRDGVEDTLTDGVSNWETEWDNDTVGGRVSVPWELLFVEVGGAVIVGGRVVDTD